MKSPNSKKTFDDIQKEVEKKFIKRDKKKQTKMKVSGGSVKKLSQIIREKWIRPRRTFAVASGMIMKNISAFPY